MLFRSKDDTVQFASGMVLWSSAHVGRHSTDSGSGASKGAQTDGCSGAGKQAHFKYNYIRTYIIYIYFSVTHVCVFSDVGIPAIVPKVWVFLRKGQFRDQSNAS